MRKGARYEDITHTPTRSRLLGRRHRGRHPGAGTFIVAQIHTQGNPIHFLASMRQRHLGNRVFPDVEYMCEAVSAAWVNVIENPQSVKSLCGFKWIAKNLN